VTRAELVITHDITNNPNDQVRPEDYENEGAIGRIPSYYIVDDPDNPGNTLWVATANSYNGEGEELPSYFKLDASGDVDLSAGGIAVYDPDGRLVGYRNEDGGTPIGTVFRDMSLATANAAAGLDFETEDLSGGYTAAWYTTVDREPFEWSYDKYAQDPYKNVYESFRSRDEGEAAGYTDDDLYSGPRWRLTPNKFGQDLPGLEVPVIPNSQPPFQNDNIEYPTGELTTTRLNLLDWEEDSSPLRNSEGWMTVDRNRLDENKDGLIDEGWSKVNGVFGEGDALPMQILSAVSPNGVNLSTNFLDTAVYVKGDRQDSAKLYDIQLEIDYANQVIGTDGDDYLVGTTGDDYIFGGLGNDTIDALAGNDHLYGEGGNDILNGDEDNDYLDGGTGADTMSGGLGDDTYIVDQNNYLLASGDDVQENANAGLDTVMASSSYTLTANVENGELLGLAANSLVGNNLDNVLVGNGGANILLGGIGNDTLDGGEGADVLRGGASSDRYHVDNVGDLVVEELGAGTDEVHAAISYTLTANVEKLMLEGEAYSGTGNSADNVLMGSANINALNGGDGADVINGGGELDYLTGGAGNDTFAFWTLEESGPYSAQRDRIVDFAIGDAIDVSTIDANSTVDGNQAFVLDNDGSFSAGEIRQTQYGANLLLEMNVDADAEAEMSILALNLGLLTDGDFVL
jgi:Ca2+-binding RTX toxin-like protein